MRFIPKQVAMRHRRLPVAFASLFALIYSPLNSAAAPAPDLRAELVAIVNMTPGNPLGGEIWLIGLDGKLLRRVTNGNDYEEHPRFSPDGGKIVFVRNMSGPARARGLNLKENEIFVYDLRTGKETQLTRDHAENSHPEWSYDGNSIAFSSQRGDPNGKATLWVMRADGSNSRQVTQLKAGDLAHLDPTWSPDGNWLAFVNVQKKGGRLHSRIEKVRLDGSQRTVVSSGGRPWGFEAAQGQESWGDLEPVYSPDGGTIWSARRLGDGSIHLYAFSAGAYYPGKAEIDMSRSSGADSIERSPSFSPDGRRIILTRLVSSVGAKTRQLVLTNTQSSFRRYIIGRDDWDVRDPGWYPFAQSGAERDDASVMASYNAGAAPQSDRRSVLKDGGDLSGRGSEPSKTVQATLRTVQSSAPDASASVYEARWKLEMAPQRVLSMALRLEGRLSAGSVKEGLLRFQLMDWEKRNWVEVLTKPQNSHGEIKIYHELSPANFINRETGEVALRLVVSGTPATQPAPTLDFDLLRLDVRRD